MKANQKDVGVREIVVLVERAGGRLNIKISSYEYKDSHYKGKTVTTVLSLQ